MIAGWLRTPEVVRWWGDPDEQYALVSGDLSDPRMRQWIVEHDGEPFTYVQAFEAHAWGSPHLLHLPVGTEAIDAFTGAPAMLGQGHGGRLLAQFAQMLIDEGAPAVVIDPDPENLRARRAYARAGFVEDGVVEAEDGPAVVMVRWPSSRQGAVTSNSQGKPAPSA